MSEFKGFIYIWRDRKNNRYYVGCHIGEEEDGYICSSSWMLKAIRRRPEDFRRRIIKRITTSRIDLYTEEKRYLAMIKPEEVKVKYYNLNTKGNNPWYQYPDKVKTIGEKISIKNTGKIHGPCSEDKKEKIRQATKGVKKTYTEESYQRLVDSHKGREHSEEWKQENSERLKEQWANGTRKALETQSEESNKKRSEKLKGRQLTTPTEESRQKQSDARKTLWADPAYREKMTAIRRNRKKKEL